MLCIPVWQIWKVFGPDPDPNFHIDRIQILYNISAFWMLLKKHSHVKVCKIIPLNDSFGPVKQKIVALRRGILKFQKGSHTVVVSIIVHFSIAKSFNSINPLVPNRMKTNDCLFIFLAVLIQKRSCCNFFRIFIYILLTYAEKARLISTVDFKWQWAMMAKP
jgi:hypothetical protein